jgi:DNA-binding GntR family transcriptional regulator
MRIPRGHSQWTARLAVDGRGSSQAGILSELRRVILDGDAPPGTTIPVDDVAALFGVSRIPVREALKALISEGLVSQRPHADYRVSRLTRSELQQFYTVRGVLELATLTAAVELACDDDDREAHSAHAALLQAIRDGDVRGHHRESRRFHLALLVPSRMDRTLHMLESAWNMTEPVQPMAYAGPVEGATFNEDHRLMLEAFLARDAPSLVQVTTDHQRHLEELISTLPDSDRFADE